MNKKIIKIILKNAKEEFINKPISSTLSLLLVIGIIWSVISVAFTGELPFRLPSIQEVKELDVIFSPEIYLKSHPRKTYILVSSKYGVFHNVGIEKIEIYDPNNNLLLSKLVNKTYINAISESTFNMYYIDMNFSDVVKNVDVGEIVKVKIYLISDEYEKTYYSNVRIED